MKALERLSKRKSHSEAIIAPDLARAMTELSADLNRQIGLLLDRRNRVSAVVVGDARSLFLPDIFRKGRDRLCGLRLIHSHLTDAPLNDDDLTDLALLRMDHIAAIVVGSDGLPGKVYQAHLLPANAGNEPWEILSPTLVHDLPEDFPAAIKALEEEFIRLRTPKKAGDKREVALLIHVSTKPPTVAQDSLDELSELARSAGIKCAKQIIQRAPTDRKHVMGKGKLKSAIIQAMQVGAELLVFDLNLSPSQVKAMAHMTDLKILDRTQVILDIFAQHAETREGKLQVELAQLRYLQPFLGVSQSALSRLTGGIGGRGPGETKLEVNRRRAQERISRLDKEVKQLGKRRKLRRGVRHRKQVPTLAVVGYTNAGKSTLLNHLTNSQVQAEDALFATLNPVSRRLRFPEEREVIITDTVGFIRDLPKELKAAFHTTFEEIHEADLLLHVMDASSMDIEDKHEVVQKLLDELGLEETPMVHVLNKTDLSDPETVMGLRSHYNGIPVCALDRGSFGPLLEVIEALLFSRETSNTECE
jgi:GTP-binding protein HflX